MCLDRLLNAGCASLQWGRSRSLSSSTQKRRAEDRTGRSSGDKFFVRAPVHLTQKTDPRNLSPRPCSAALYGAMPDNVSIRNITTRTKSSTGCRFNSKARCADDLQRALPLWPRERDDRSVEGREKLIVALERALRRERRNGRAGHPAYDLERHASLNRILKMERAALAALPYRVHQPRRPPQK